MIETYWDKYINRDLTEIESEEFYLLLKDDKDIQSKLIDLIYDEAIFGQSSDELLAELNPLYDNNSDVTPPLPLKKSRTALYTILSVASLLMITFTMYYFYGINTETIKVDPITSDPIVVEPKEKIIKKEVVSNGFVKPEELSIEQMKLPVALATVQYPSKRFKNVYSWYSNTLVNYGPIFSNLNLTNKQKSNLKKLFTSNYRTVMGGYMKNIKQINYTCPLAKIISKNHVNDFDKEMFVWARAHVAMTTEIEKKILVVLDDDQKSKYLSLFKVIDKYSNENGHLYLSGSNEKLKKNTLEYLEQLQPLLK